MNRRRFGLGVGCLLAGSLAGCLGGTDQPSGPNQSESRTDASDPKQLVERDPSVIDREVNTAPAIQDFPGRDTLSDTATATTFTQFGTSEDAHQVVIVSESASPLETTISIRRTNGTPFYNETVSLSTDSYAVYEFQQYSEYSVEITSPQHSTALDVQTHLIDCNDSHQIVQLIEGGTIDVSTGSTLMGCQ